MQDNFDYSKLGEPVKSSPDVGKNQVIGEGALVNQEQDYSDIPPLPLDKRVGAIARSQESGVASENVDQGLFPGMLSEEEINKRIKQMAAQPGSAMAPAELTPEQKNTFYQEKYSQIAEQRKQEKLNNDRAETAIVPTKKQPPIAKDFLDLIKIKVEKHYADYGITSPTEKFAAFHNQVQALKDKYNALLQGADENTAQAFINRYTVEFDNVVKTIGIEKNSEGAYVVPLKDIDYFNNLVKDITTRDVEVRKRYEQEQAALAEKDRVGYGNKLLYALATTTAHMLNSPDYIAMMLEQGVNELSKKVGLPVTDTYITQALIKRDQADYMRELSEVSDQSIVSLVQQGEWLEAAKKTGVSVAEQLPNILGLVVSSGVASAARSAELAGTAVQTMEAVPGMPKAAAQLSVEGKAMQSGSRAAGVTMGVTSGSRQYAAREESDLPYLMRVADAFVNGFAETLSELTTTIPILDQVKKSVLENGRKKFIEIAAEATLPRYERKIQSVMKGFVVPGLKEASGEVLNEVYNDLTDMALGLWEPGRVMGDGYSDIFITSMIMGSGANINNELVRSKGKAAVREAYNQTPAEYSVEGRVKSTELLLQRMNAQYLMDKVADVYKPKYQADIDAIDKKLFQIGVDEKFITGSSFQEMMDQKKTETKKEAPKTEFKPGDVIEDESSLGSLKKTDTGYEIQDLMLGDPIQIQTQDDVDSHIGTVNELIDEAKNELDSRRQSGIDILPYSVGGLGFKNKSEFIKGLKKYVKGKQVDAMFVTEDIKYGDDVTAEEVNEIIDQYAKPGSAMTAPDAKLRASSDLMAIVDKAGPRVISRLNKVSELLTKDLQNAEDIGEGAQAQGAGVQAEQGEAERLRVRDVEENRVEAAAGEAVAAVNEPAADLLKQIASVQLNISNIEYRLTQKNQPTQVKKLKASLEEEKKKLADLQAQVKPETKRVVAPETSSHYANMTEDEEGNFVFYHVGPAGIDVIDPGKSGTNKRSITSKEELSAISKVGGLSMYYVNNTDSDGKQTGNKYMVKVPANKVYDANSDVNGYAEEAAARFKKEHPDSPYTANDEIAYITKIAGENGYQMTVADWRDGTRAQTTEKLSPVQVQKMSSNAIQAPFKDDYKSNKTKGYESVVPETRQDKLNDVYDQIHKYKNGKQEYDDLYRLYSDSGKYTQDEITKMIKASKLPASLKKLYNEAVNYKSEPRKSIKTKADGTQGEQEQIPGEVRGEPAADQQQPVAESGQAVPESMGPVAGSEEITLDLNQQIKDVDVEKIDDVDLHREIKLRANKLNYEISDDQTAVLAGLLKERIGQVKAGTKEGQKQKWTKTDSLDYAIDFAVTALVRNSKKIKPLKLDPAFTNKPNGNKVTAANRTYDEAVANNPSEDSDNLWIRQSKNKTNKGRTLLVQFSSEFLYGARPRFRSFIDKYYDKIYRVRTGYKRTYDFWEVPLWISRLAHTDKNSDVYVIRDLDEAKKFFAEAGYDKICFSMLDINKNHILDIASSLPNQNIQVGGYTTFDDVKQHKNIKVFTTVEEWAKFNKLPKPDGYSYRHFKNTAIIPRLKMSDGCLHKCAFCTVPKGVKPVSDAIIDQQVESIQDLDAKLVYLDDKTFGQAGNYKKLEEIYNRIKKYNPDFEGFVIQTTAPQFNKMSDEFIEKAHIRYVELGVETYNADVLKKMRKPSTIKTIDEAVNKMRRLGVAFIPNVVVGFPSETNETYNNTLEFLKKNRDIISHMNVYSLAVYEGTELSDSIEVKTEADNNENIVEKSFRNQQEKQWDQKAMDDFGQFGMDVLDKEPGHIGKREEAKKKIAEGFEGLASKLGGLKKLTDEESEKTWSYVKQIAEGVYELGIIDVQDFINRIKDHLKQYIQDPAAQRKIRKYINDNEGRIRELYNAKAKTRKFAEQLLRSKDISDEVKAAIEGDVKNYIPISNEYTQQEVEAIVKAKGLQDSMLMLMNNQNDIIPRVRVALGEQILAELNEVIKDKGATESDKKKAIADEKMVTEYMTKLGTALGQGVQAFAMWSKLHPRTLKEMILEEVEKAGKTLTEEQIKELDGLIDKMTAAPEGFQKFGAVTDLLKFQMRASGLSLSDLLTSTWYAHILSGYSTQLLNILANTTQTASEVLVNMLYRPAAAKKMLMALFDGYGRGFLEAVAVVKTGYSPLKQASWTFTSRSDVEKPNVLEAYNGFKFAGRRWNPLLLQRYVRRLMMAADTFFFHGLKEMRAAELAHMYTYGKEKKYDPVITEYIQDKVLNRKKNIASARIQAEKEGLKKGSLDYRRRVWEIMEDTIPEKLNENASSFASHGTFNYSVEGRVGQVTDSISHLSNRVKAFGVAPIKFIVPFATILSNVANNYLDWTPYGIVRGLRGRIGSKESGKYTREYTEDERAKEIIKGSAGTLAALAVLALANLADEGEEEPWFEITAGGKGDYRFNYNLQEVGWQKYSVRIGDRWFSYMNTPLAIPFTVIGSIMDNKKYQGMVLEGKEDYIKATELVLWSTVQYFTDLTFLRGLSEFFTAIGDRNQDSAARYFTKFGTNIIKGFAVPNIVTQVSRKVQETYDMPAKEANGLWQQMYRDIPFARNHLNDMINGLGEKVIPNTHRWINKENEDPIWQLIVDNNAWITKPAKNVFTYDADGELRKLDNQEYYQYALIRGQEIKKRIEKNYKKLQKMDKAEVQQEISDYIRDAGKVARKELAFGKYAKKGKADANKF